MPRTLVDTNILLLLVLGNFNPDIAMKHRRMQTFRHGDFPLLQNPLRSASVVVTTPAILAETSNLLGNYLHLKAAASLVATCVPFVEIVQPKDQILRSKNFAELGFTDASILLALDERTSLLTDDVRLYAQALHEGRDAMNFNHLRDIL